MDFLEYIKTEGSVRVFNCIESLPEKEVIALCRHFHLMFRFVQETKNFGIKSAEELYGLYFRWIFFKS